MQIFICRGDERSGPFSKQQVENFMAQGVLLPDDLAWHEGLEGWIPLEELTAQATVETSPPLPAQPVPAIDTASAKGGGKKKLFIELGAAAAVVAAVVAMAVGVWFWLAPEKEKKTGDDPNSKSPVTKSPNPTVPAGQLTAAEASEILAEDIGSWKLTGKRMRDPEGEDAPDAEQFESIIDVRWKVEGKSLVFTWATVNNGNKVQFVGYKEFDAKKGIFTFRSKGDGFLELIKRERYDRQTKTFHSEFTYPDGAEETTTFQIVDKDKRLDKSHVTLDGKVVFRSESTFTRMADDNRPSNPVIAKLTPEEAAEVMAWEI
ncbi:MAG: hypothetical protein CL509_09990, partial [Actinobacteria bacterium]|nr:hypothetical protein [Actinomycetota bacterium]